MTKKNEQNQLDLLYNPRINKIRRDAFKKSPSWHLPAQR